MKKDTQPEIPQWVMNWSLIVAIVVLLVSFVNYGMSFLYPAPEYDDFCGGERVELSAPDEITTPESCRALDGKWQAYQTPRSVAEKRAAELGTTTVTGRCDIDHFCRLEFEAAQDVHDQHGLVIMLILGLFISVFGFRRRESDILATATSISGILIIISGLLRYWTLTEDWVQFTLLGSVLVMFIYLALRRNDE